jgi:hypothetical protein
MAARRLHVTRMNSLGGLRLTALNENRRLDNVVKSVLKLLSKSSLFVHFCGSRMIPNYRLTRNDA